MTLSTPADNGIKCVKISPLVAPIIDIPLLQNRYDSQDGKITKYTIPITLEKSESNFIDVPL